MLLNNDVVVTDGWLDQLIGLTAVRVTAEGICAGRDVTFIDFNEVDREGGDSAIPSCAGSPPWPPSE